MSQSAPNSINIANESFDKAVEVAPDFWIIATRHHPTGSKHQPEINNRCLIFRLKDATANNQPVLLIANAVDGSALSEVRRIERESGTPIRYLIAPGAGHNLNLVEWHDALPEATVLVGPARIPRVACSTHGRDFTPVPNIDGRSRRPSRALIPRP